jgi:hypothetical protein
MTGTHWCLPGFSTLMADPLSSPCRPTIKGLSEVLPHEIAPKSSTGAGRISDRPRLNEAAGESEPPAMEFESSAGASRESLPPDSSDRIAVGARWQGSLTSPRTPSYGGAPAVSLLPLYRRGLAGNTTPNLPRERQEKEK